MSKSCPATILGDLRCGAVAFLGIERRAEIARISPAAAGFASVKLASAINDRSSLVHANSVGLGGCAVRG
jgi:hypothetical protein